MRERTAPLTEMNVVSSDPILRVNFAHSYREAASVSVAFSITKLTTALMGPSGSGKSTTLSVIAGTLRPKFAEVKLRDRWLCSQTRGLWLSPEKRRVGYVFQDYLLFPHMTVQENLLYGWRRTNRRSISPELIYSVLELGFLLNRYPAQLSGGQKQRTALGRAILSQPDLLLLDEPVTALEMELRREVLSQLREIQRHAELPALIATHDHSIATEFADEVISISPPEITHSR